MSIGNLYSIANMGNLQVSSVRILKRILHVLDLEGNLVSLQCLFHGRKFQFIIYADGYLLFEMGLG